jgi:hypothetical protein
MTVNLRGCSFDYQGYYLIARSNQFARFEQLLGSIRFKIVDRRGGKVLFTNKHMLLMVK